MIDNITGNTTDNAPMQRLNDFILTRGLTMTTRRIGKNPYMARDVWATTASHYLCNFASAQHSRVLSTYFSMGSAHKDMPTIDDVLDSLASEAASVDGGVSFEDWCGEMGYDSDSRRAARIYNTVQNGALRLLHFLGEQDYNALLWQTERA